MAGNAVDVRAPISTSSRETCSSGEIYQPSADRRILTARARAAAVSGACCAALVMVVFAAYRPFVGGHLLLTSDSHNATALSAPAARDSVGGVARWVFALDSGIWSPLGRLSLIQQLMWFGSTLDGFRVANLALHGLACCLLFLVLARAAGSAFLAVFAAATFAAHPLCIASVAWLPGRTELVAASFGLLSVLAYLDFAERGRTSSVVASILCSVCAALSSPTLAALPALFPLMDAVAGRQAALVGDSMRDARPRSWRLHRWRWWYLTGACSAIAIAVFVRIAAIRSDSAPHSLPHDTLATIPTRCVTQVCRAVLPHWAPWELPAGRGLALTAVAAAIALLVGVSIFAWATLRRQPLISAGWLWFVATIVPAVGFVELGGRDAKPTFAYLPLIGLVTCGAFLISKVLQPGLVRAVGLPLIAVANVVIFTRMAHADAAACNDRWAALVSKFQWESDDGTEEEGIQTASFDPSANRRSGPEWIDAMIAVESAVAGATDEPSAQRKIAQACQAMNCAEAAAAHYRRAIALDDKDFAAQYNLGLILLTQQHRIEAERHFWRALEIDPTQAVAYVGIGKICEQRSENFQAVEYLRRALELDPALESRHSLGTEKLFPDEQLGDAIRRISGTPGLLRPEPDETENS
jgi:protein O-mannosyl-transferase